MLVIKQMSMDSEDAKLLIGELNQILTSLTGDDGTAHFQPNDVKQERSVFLIGYLDGVPTGCGALRELNQKIGEIKRVYARKNTCKVGHTIIQALEHYAEEFGYQEIYLETRIQNVHAIRFYEKNGYFHCENYGVYKNKSNSHCMKKVITQ